jgi:hypothetical protein
VWLISCKNALASHSSILHGLSPHSTSQVSRPKGVLVNTGKPYSGFLLSGGDDKDYPAIRLFSEAEIAPSCETLGVMPKPSSSEVSKFPGLRSMLLRGISVFAAHDRSMLHGLCSSQNGILDHGSVMKLNVKLKGAPKVIQVSGETFENDDARRLGLKRTTLIGKMRKMKILRSTEAVLSNLPQSLALQRQDYSCGEEL